jgi:hypothetical protein
VPQLLALLPTNVTKVNEPYMTKNLRFINADKVLGKNCQEYFDLSWQRHFGFACLGTLDITTKGEKL